jgi:predicted NACHT family NTPase
MADPKRTTADTFLARYLAERIGLASSADLTMDDIFALASENPLLLILDGLDEVPHPSSRDTIFRELITFLDRCEGESCDIQIILSSRPQGYRGECDGFEPIEWNVVDLDRADFDDYADRWLKERIPDVDERKDARRRIDEGMQAHAVQQMATTLLQATVMLTIARRKHPIPHARHKLYEKYVEVIFERERNKQTVRERGGALPQLHELVGYKLIRKMEAAEGARTLGGEEFKRCVQQVIEDYGPNDLGEASIGMVVEEIVTLAKDRLCRLTGKGEDQQDVDFIIQPFREYFAAAYLAHHEDADPDRVYANLVERRHIWANVLQFYAAFQSKAQQKNWISEADGTDTNQDTYEGIVKMTRKRRALLRVLPEFERPKNEYIQRLSLRSSRSASSTAYATR